jgi:hypothetical protein
MNVSSIKYRTPFCRVVGCADETTLANGYTLGEFVAPPLVKINENCHILKLGT